MGFSDLLVKVGFLEASEEANARRTKISRESGDEPLYNVDISLNDWQGPFKDKDIFEIIAKRYVDATKNFAGKRKVLRNGKLYSGSDSRLHTRKGSVNLYELGQPHVHFDDGGLQYVEGPLAAFGGVTLDSTRKYWDDREFLGGDKRLPWYTLSGLYSTLPNEKISTRINALEEHLKHHANFDFGSIAKRKETRLKLLENAYRRLVSNQ